MESDSASHLLLTSPIILFQLISSERPIHHISPEGAVCKMRSLRFRFEGSVYTNISSQLPPVESGSAHTPVCAQVLKEEFLPPPNPPRGESTQLIVKSCHCQFSSKEIVHKKSVDSVLCGFSGGTGQRKEMLLFHMSFLNTESHQQNPIHLDSFRCRG